jgi:Ni/Co efflux regulator RcnB
MTPSLSSLPVKPSVGAKLAMAVLLCAFSAGSMADKPDWAGGGKHGKHAERDEMARGDDDQGGKHKGHEHQKEKKHKGDRQAVVGGYFDDDGRRAAHAYYEQQYRVGRCPPGLAKKHNGCMPPGQAKKYAVGQPLPVGVVWYPVPAPVVVQLGAPPSGYRYVRVASDILLIAVGSSMVVDAIQDLARL